MISCVAIDDEPMALDVIELYCADCDLVELKATFRDPLKAMAYLKREKVDLIFLDINMPEMSGMQLAQTLSPAPMIIFTTAYSHYAVESYNLNAVDYLLKPIVFERFQIAINKAAKAASLQNSDNNDDTTVYLKSGSQTYPVKRNEILYLEKDGNYMTVHLKNKNILIRENMSSVFELVPATDFIRVHKSYVIAIKHVTMIEAQQLTVGGEKIPIGNSYRDLLRARLRIP
ncbi:LytR/AlgR family response regulator transcription factor [Mucilaginibacter sp. SJ]|uniref:LytR/AlgR family response regulator transcription factor n=1 Tax=Mucilaginibacter sp. SJ TaxID=3029053 RepID=UPI0023A9A307|nr:LytTR family DNA-binding domain-containing protein [Mucilaginibacter sp. SJ]WEA01915.1 LytTR family DNA-binding domain-containing protein [Mucilaginibacter sp. SJ]